MRERLHAKCVQVVFHCVRVHKCVSEGRVTYQNDPCPSGPAGKRPTVEELNAERLKRMQQNATAIGRPRAAFDVAAWAREFV